MGRRRFARIEDDSLDDYAPTARRRRRPRRRWRLLAALALLVALAAAAPTIIARTPLRNVLLACLTPEDAGRLSADAADFSWSAGQTLDGLRLVDPSGALLLSAERVAVSRSIIGFAANPANLGKLTLTRPTIYLNTRSGASNVEDFLARLAEAQRDSQPSSPDAPPMKRTVEIEIVDGVVVGQDEATGQAWRIDGLAATAAPAADAPLWDVAAAGVMTLAAGPPVVDAALGPAAASPPGRFKLHLKPSQPAAAAEPRWEAALVADRVPLAPIEPWLARALSGARLTGEASADMHVSWGRPSAQQPPAAMGQGGDVQFVAAGKIDASHIRFTSAALSGDLVELPTASIALDATLNGRRIAARQCTARSDWFQAELNGEFDMAQLAELSLRSLPTSDASITARASLPQLMRMLPRTLRLRPGLRVDAGSIEVTARSARADSGRRWTVAAAVEDLLGTDGVRPIRWSEPIELGVEAAQSSDGPQLQRAILRAAFASATVDGAAGGLEGQLQFNLSELAEQLGQFVDLSAWQLRGAGQGEFSLRDTGADRFAASAQLDLSDIDVQRHGKVVWQDPKLHLEAQASGNRQRFTPQRFDAATFTMRGVADAFTAELLEPVSLDGVDPTWAVRVTGNGPLDRWAGRLRPWASGVPEHLAGQSTVAMEIHAREGLVHVTQSKLSVQKLEAQFGPTTIQEDRVEAEGDFRWEAAARALDSHDLQFTSGSLAARARGLSVRLADAGPPTVRGEVAFRGDFERLAAWLDLAAPAEPGLRPRGQAVGRLQLASDADRATAQLTLTSEPLQLVNSLDGTVAWNEPRVELSTEAAYTSADDRLQLTSVRLTGKTLQLTGAGTIEQLRTAGLVRGDMNVTYDAAEMARLLAAYVGPGVQIQGANTARVQAAGRLRASAPGAAGGLLGVTREVATETTWNSGEPTPRSREPSTLAGGAHWSRRWQVTTETGWSAANLYGLPLGAARLTASVRDGQVQFTPLDLAVGQGGRISLQPRVLLDPAPQVLELAGGQTISNVAISQEVSQRMLKYAAPIVAGATRTEGSFSFFLEGARIPLRQPKQGQLKGRLTVHRLAVLPGPMIQQIAALIRHIEAAGKSSQNLGQGLEGLGGLLGGVAPPAAQPLKGVTMTERAIDVQVVDGRVYHRNLEFLIDDVPVSSQGSVGFDETLALLVEVPVQKKWVGSRPALQGLVGQKIQIPVSGTFSQPKIDERAIGAFLAQAAQSAAGGLLGEELNKALDKLLRPK